MLKSVAMAIAKPLTILYNRLLEECQCPDIYKYSHGRGAVVEWLERLAVVRKVAGSSPARVKRLENSHCPPSSECVPD